MPLWLFLLLILSSLAINSIRATTLTNRESRSIDDQRFDDQSTSLIINDGNKHKTVSQRLIGGHLNNNNAPPTDATDKHTSINNSEQLPIDGSEKGSLNNSEDSKKQLSIDGTEEVIKNNLKSDTADIYQNDEESLQMESAGAGKKSKEKKVEEKNDDDDEKKSLSQQVAEGKYGLIQKELFSKPEKSFGILSYKNNPEVPKDNRQNLGGLNVDEIWLAEDHLLVLKGGLFSGSKKNVNWPPIDNYHAPRRPVKIPLNPKVPPPFPVQLQDGGPIQIFGANGTSKTLSEDIINTIYPPEGYPPGTGPFFPPLSNANEGDTPFPVPPYRIAAISGNFSKGNGPLPFPLSFPTAPYQKPGALNPQPLPPFLASLPPNAVYLPAPQNQTDTYEEDDPSIYYPPPYTFYYSRDEQNGQNVPAGPLVPGIILPPPPDFFAPLKEQNADKNRSEENEIKPQPPRNRTTILKPYRKPYYSTKIPHGVVYTTKLPTKTVVYTPPTQNGYTTTKLPPATYTTKPPSTVYTKVYTTQIPPTTPAPPTTTSNRPETIEIIEKPAKPVIYVPEKENGPERIPIIIPAEDISDVPNNTLDSVSTPLPVAPIVSTPRTKLKNSDYYSTTEGDQQKKIKIYRVKPTSNTIFEDSFVYNPIYGPAKKPGQFAYNRNAQFSTTTANPQPIQGYFTTNNDIESNSVTSDPITYYQERRNNLAARASPKFPTPTNSEYFYFEEPKTTSERQHDYQYYKAPIGVNPPIYDIHSQIVEKLKTEIQSYLTSPKYKVEKQTTSKPIYQYSFQAADYEAKNLRNKNTEHFQPISNLNPIKIYSSSIAPPNGYQEPIVSTVRPNYQLTTESPYNEETLKQQQPGTQSYRRVPNIYQPRPTENPINHASYTKQDESLLDDITKQYFNVFGQKIANGERQNPGRLTTPIGTGSVSTTPLTPTNSIYTPKPSYIDVKPQNVEIHFGDNSQNDQPIKPPNLHSDILVNDRHPLPPINPDAEFITPVVVNTRNQYPEIQNETPNKPVSLESDIEVNYRQPRPNIHPDAEFITPVILNPSGFKPATGQRLVVDYRKQNSPIYTIRKQQRPPTLETDILINSKNPRPPINPDAEVFEPVVVNPPNYENREPIQYDDSEAYRRNKAQLITNSYVQEHPIKNPIRNRYRQYQRVNSGQIIPAGRPIQITDNRNGGAFISFPLPGNGAHFYFLTPQVIKKPIVLDSQEHSQFVYSEPNQRLRRSRIRNREEQIYRNGSR